MTVLGRDGQETENYWSENMGMVIQALEKGEILLRWPEGKYTLEVDTEDIQKLPGQNPGICKGK